MTDVRASGGVSAAAPLPAAGERILPRVIKGQRSHFFDDPTMDQMMTFFMELMTEVMVLRDRQDTLERALEDKGGISRAELRTLIPPPEVEAERAADRAAFVERVLRLHEPSGAEPEVR
ncbi:hypothetical protein [Nitrospirillum sp. BR 11828]|uniref:hypothetical protein n=1 Tax=Nitrospirillum sp. BR 11828 TaxID=3104325 RepID=UPI002ACAEB24|nr:hypothetical protein [Nitrospirillum sp. BR 11828]MDZ5650037.1 hypothetical protein [Nitrospirillum sp. BR 11828]